MNYIVDDIGAVVELMRTDAELIAALEAGLPALTESPYSNLMPFYLYGHRAEISDTLLQMDDDKVRKYQKYPLVALRLDTPEENSKGMVNYTLNIALIMLTDENYEAPDRYVNVFKPILYPMYDSFLRQLKASGLFSWPLPNARPDHTKYDRPYWGIEQGDGNVKNIFNDPLDAIELINLKLSQPIKC